MKDLTWKCEVCKKERLDEDISVVVLKHKRKDGGAMARNVKYCNDDVTCLMKAAYIAGNAIHGFQMIEEKKS